MQNNALKLLAQKAKKRLTSAGQNIDLSTQTKQKAAYLSPSTYAIVATKQRIEEDPRFEKVKKLLTKEDVLNPLAELTDTKLFNTLSDIEKEKYIIDISKRYNEIKDYFLTQKFS